MSVFEKIEAQQKGQELTPVWTVGEQLKDICRSDSTAAQLVDQDLDIPEMSLQKAEEKIRAWADKQKKPNLHCVCVPPQVAEGIIREFYGLPNISEDRKDATTVDTVTHADSIDLADFF